ncbi:MAG TPA: hypothetical protein VKZ75_00750 [Cyclobacteriaceae bacterium]|nr:hypothetical protein [Cyclobacteriaceae bacterium]
MKEEVFYDLSIAAGSPTRMKDIVHFVSRYWFLIIVGILFVVLMGMAIYA